MSQQMFDSEENQQQEQQEQQSQQGWWASEPSRKNAKMRETPKNEHPSTFEEPFAAAFPYDTLSQDTVDSTIDSTDSTATNQDGEKIAYQNGYAGYTGNSQQYSFSPDGDAMESGYRPYNAYNPTANASTPTYVPSWARPQHNNSVGRILAKVILILVVGMLILKVIIPLLIVLFAFAAVFAVILVVGLLVFGVFVFGFLRLLGIRVPFRPVRFLRRHGHGRWRHLRFDL